MEFNREAKNLIATMAFVASMAFGMNAVVVAEPDRSFISWSIGLFVVAVLFWIWMRRDDLAEKRESSLKAAEDAARQAEELAKKAQAQAEAELDTADKADVVADEEVHDYTEELEEAVEDAEDETLEPVDEALRGKEDPAKEVVEEGLEVVDVDAPDDLSRIEGIGPVYQGILKDAGVGSFAAIASRSQEELEQIIKDAGKRRPASIETWAEQAALAAVGDWDGLAKLQSQLDGGRRT